MRATQTLPDRMNAVQLDAAGGALAVRQWPVPRPGPGQVLIKMAAAPINPSDLGSLAGSSGERKPSPVVPGLEGSGIVVAAGPGLFPRLLVGRRVAFASAQGGTWAEYAVSPAMRCIPLARSVSLEQAATLIVNPLTALAFLDFARRGKHAGIVNNAASSALGHMMVRLGRTHGLTVINIVRRPEQVEMLRAIGAEHVLDSTESEFAPRLGALARRFNATLFLDAVGGAQTQTLVEAAPFGSTIVAYAALSGETSAFHTRTLIGGDKKISGFYLGNWVARRGTPGTLRDFARVQRLSGAELQTTVRRRLPLSAAQAAVEMYRANMTGGKILLVADPEQVPLDHA
ncbi:MAG: zinc-binding dehydrogenase [Acidobacteriia bacterium]|nr:zinc-binding dehydrogenase [Terriglobia bacterium]